ncbi:hypothetical protein HPB50_008688 [Hyalomma asiaticum]|uniref:Uncharacterized protein n=1 Tax=Hyalomma asiaticum TaxID=266040 RepID=A0ACB7RTB4_HYAAI|nr:hypothetical protein HPB50_008688 [Hyalomma asiaticum]
MREVKKVVKCHKLLVVGHCNAPHGAWGYGTISKTGMTVHSVAEQHQLTLYYNPYMPTGIGSSVSRDSSTDLMFCSGFGHTEWMRLDETMGSDHHIIQTTIRHNRTPVQVGEAKITNRQTSRKARHPTNFEDIQEWRKNVMGSATKFTKTIQLRLGQRTTQKVTHICYASGRLDENFLKQEKQKRNRKLKTPLLHSCRRLKHIRKNSGARIGIKCGIVHRATLSTGKPGSY